MIKIIVDLGSNHNQSEKRMMVLIDAAKKAGAWGVKFQLFRAHALYHHSFNVDFERMKKHELNPDLMIRSMQYAKNIGLAVGVTFFHESDICKYTTDDIDFLKISSFDWKRDSLIRKALLMTKHRLIISTGLMNIDQFGDMEDKIMNWTYELAIPEKEIIFLHCVSQYPAEDGCFRFMRRMWKTSFFPLGYSDHTGKVTEIMKAVELGAEYIEVHLDLVDEKGYENIGHCWTPDELKLAITSARLQDESMLDKDISTEQLMLSADPEDGMRPLKEYR